MNNFERTPETKNDNLLEVIQEEIDRYTQEFISLKNKLKNEKSNLSSEELEWINKRLIYLEEKLEKYKDYLRKNFLDEARKIEKAA